MAIRNILKGEDNPRLRKKSKPVEIIDDRIIQLIEDMKETLREEEGAGLAAPQVGVLRRVIIVNYDEKMFEIINPEISNPSGSAIEREACLSLLPVTGCVERPEKLTVTGKRMNGESLKIEAEGMLARIVCHEVDHLNGILFVDRVIPDEALPEDEDAEALEI